MSESQASLKRSLGLGLVILAGLIIYAYGFQVIKVNFAETRQPRRQEQLTRILRAIAQPDLFEYQTTEVQINTPIYVPCPAGGAPSPATPASLTAEVGVHASGNTIIRISGHRTMTHWTPPPPGSRIPRLSLTTSAVTVTSPLRGMKKKTAAKTRVAGRYCS